jgi:hypothetical protein
LAGAQSAPFVLFASFVIFVLAVFLKQRRCPDEVPDNPLRGLPG